MVEYILIKLATNVKLGGVADSLEGHEAIQKDLDSLDRLAHGKLIEFNKK